MYILCYMYIYIYIYILRPQFQCQSKSEMGGLSADTHGNIPNKQTCTIHTYPLCCIAYITVCYHVCARTCVVGMDCNSFERLLASWLAYWWLGYSLYFDRPLLRACHYLASKIFQSGRHCRLLFSCRDSLQVHNFDMKSQDAYFDNRANPRNTSSVVCDAAKTYWNRIIVPHSNLTKCCLQIFGDWAH